MSSMVMRASAAEKVASASASAGRTTLLIKRGRRQRRLARHLGAARGAHDVLGADVVLLARELIAAVRPADTAQDAVAHQRLQHRLEMARRQLVARGKRLGRNRAIARVHGDVDDGGECEDAFARNERH